MAPPRGLGLEPYQLINLVSGAVMLERWLRREDAERYNQLWSEGRVGARWEALTAEADALANASDRLMAQSAG